MAKNKLKMLFGVLLATLSLGMVTACTTTPPEDSDDSDSSIVTEMQTGYVVNGAVGNTLTVGNATQTFTFANAVQVNDGFTYSVHTDPNGMTAAVETAELGVGENVFYVLVKGDGYQESNKLTVYRKQMFSVKFDLNGGVGDFATVSVEENEKLSVPDGEPTRTGFTFDGWDYNFNLAVDKSFTVKAVWRQAQVKYTVKIQQTDDAETFVENEALSGQYDGFVESIVYATAPKIDGYQYVESESEYSGAVKADGSLVLTLRYYRLVQVTGEVQVPAGNKSLTVAVYNENSNFYQTFDEVIGGKVQIDLEAPVGNTSNTLKVRALGYSDVKEIVVAKDDVEFEFAPKTYSFGAFSANGLDYSSAATENAAALTSAANTDKSVNWNKISTANGELLQARGRSHAVLFENFAETEYAVSATVHTFNAYGTGTLGTSYSSRSGGFVVATAHDQLHVLITDKGSVWIGFGYLSGTNDVPNGELYLKGNATSAFVAYNPSEGVLPVTASGGYEMTLMRKDNVLTLYVGGVKYLTLDSQNGAVGYEHLSSVSPTYVAGSTTATESKLKERLAHFLATDMANAVGFTTFRKTIDATRGYTGAVFSECDRTTDVSAAIAMQEQIRSDGKKIVKSVTLNNKTLNSTQLNANTVRYASTSKESILANEKVSNTWIYDVEGKDLYCTYKTTENLATNHTVYMNDIQENSFTFTFTGALAYRQGFVITDGTNRVALVGESASGTTDLLRLCNDDNGNSVMLKGQGITDENTVWRVVVTKNEKMEIYLTNAATGNQEKLAITITKTTLTTHVGTMNDGSTSLTNHNILSNVKGLLESKQLACGFTFTTKSANRPSLTTVFKDISVTAKPSGTEN